MVEKTPQSLDAAMIVSASELGEIVGIDLETINNWLRRGIINRSTVGGRQLRNRLFSTEEVYKAALTNELVHLGIAPSLASDAVNDLWKEWQRAQLRNEGDIYAVISPNNQKRFVVSWWQKQSRGHLRHLASSADPSTPDLLAEAFAVVPISVVIAGVTRRLAILVGDAKACGQ
jgi:hypothetical protein